MPIYSADHVYLILSEGIIKQVQNNEITGPSRDGSAKKYMQTS